MESACDLSTRAGSMGIRSCSAMQLSLRITWATLDPDSIEKQEIGTENVSQLQASSGYITRPRLETLKRKKKVVGHGGLYP